MKKLAIIQMTIIIASHAYSNEKINDNKIILEITPSKMDYNHFLYTQLTIGMQSYLDTQSTYVSLWGLSFAYDYLPSKGTVGFSGNLDVFHMIHTEDFYYQMNIDGALTLKIYEKIAPSFDNLKINKSKDNKFSIDEMFDKRGSVSLRIGAIGNLSNANTRHYTYIYKKSFSYQYLVFVGFSFFDLYHLTMKPKDNPKYHKSKGIDDKRYKNFYIDVIIKPINWDYGFRIGERISVNSFTISYELQFMYYDGISYKLGLGYSFSI